MSKPIHKIYIWTLFIIGISVTFLILIKGSNYYSTPLEERFYTESHELYKPSGLYGHGMGIIGSVFMLGGVGIYMVRKRSRKLIRWGLLKHWLELHIFFCSVGPILVLFHTAFKFGGIVAISFWSMVAVALSGVVGRFIYVLIPRTMEGHEFSLTELEKENAKLYNKLHHHEGLHVVILDRIDNYINEKYSKSYSIGESLNRLIKDYINNKKLINEVKSGIINKSDSIEVISLLKRRLYVNQRMSILASIQQLFRYWHIIHLPFALVMIIIMFIHIGVTVAFGYKWIF